MSEPKTLARYPRGPDMGYGIARRHGTRIVNPVWPARHYACYEQLADGRMVHRGVCQGARAAVRWLERRPAEVVPIPGISEPPAS